MSGSTERPPGNDRESTGPDEDTTRTRFYLYFGEGSKPKKDYSSGLVFHVFEWLLMRHGDPVKPKFNSGVVYFSDGVYDSKPKSLIPDSEI